MENTKKLYRSVTDRYIGGVCGGLAKYFNTDVAIIRLLFFIALIIGGGGFLAYIILWIVVPEEPINHRFNMETNNKQEDFSEYEQNQNNTSNNQKKTDNMNDSKHYKNKGNLTAGLILIGIGSLFLLDNLIANIDFGDLWPVFIIIAGIAILLNSFNQYKNKSHES